MLNNQQIADNSARVNEAVLKALNAGNSAQVLAKASFNQPAVATQGLQGYDLEGPAKLLYPVLTPLRNSIARVTGGTGSQANWKAITAIDLGTSSLGISEGKRGGQIGATVKDYSASYKFFGHEVSATFEAVYAAEGYDDIRARLGTTGLNGFMIQEEKVMLCANATIDLGTTPTPVVAPQATGGTIPAATYSVICVALTAEGRKNASILNGVTGRYTRTNMDGSTDIIDGGAAQKSAAASVVTTTGTSRITAVVTAIRGAFAYAWYVGGVGTETLAAISGSPTLNLLALPPGGRQAASALTAVDASTNNLVYDGLLAQAVKSGNGGYWLDRGGLNLTSDGAGGIVEFDAILRRYYDLLRMSPEQILISASEAASITQAMLAAGQTTGALHMTVDVNQGAMMGGIIVSSYLNKYANGGQKGIPIVIHPDMPQGTILFWSRTVPYPLSNVANVVQVKCRQDYYQIEWPLRTRAYEYGIYADCVLQHYFPPSLMVLTGVGTYQETDVLA